MRFGKERLKIDMLRQNILPHDSPYWWNGDLLLRVHMLAKDRVRTVLFHHAEKANPEEEQRVAAWLKSVVNGDHGFSCHLNWTLDNAYQASGTPPSVEVFVDRYVREYVHYLWHAATYRCSNDYQHISVWTSKRICALMVAHPMAYFLELAPDITEAKP